MAEAVTALVETAISEERHGVLTWMGLARDRFGKGVLAQVFEMFRLSRGPTGLSPGEYFMYHLFDDRRFAPEAKRTFAGMPVWGELRAELLFDPWDALGDDKPLVNDLLRAHGLPVCETQALVHPFRATLAGPTLRGTDDVRRFLRHEARYPLFAKPAAGRAGLGVASIEAFEGDELVLRGGARIALDQYLHAMASFADAGILFDTQLVPHPAVAAVVGDRVATVRLLVLVPDGRGPEIHRAVWRIPARANLTDNFWRPGNLIGRVDPEDGRLEQVVHGESGTYDRAMFHPDTTAAFHGVVLPDWEAVRAHTLSAAALFPRLPIQAWDLALTINGPRLLDLAPDGGEPGLLQAPYDTGLLAGTYLEVLEGLRRRRAEGAERSRAYRKDLARKAYDDAQAKRIGPGEPPD